VNGATTLSSEVLRINATETAACIETAIRKTIFQDFKRRGAVVGLSGGIDSSVVAALCVRALGSQRVLGVFMPDSDSSDDSLRLGKIVAEALAIKTQLENITPILDAAGCYRRRDDAIRKVIPAYTSGYKCKLVLPDMLVRTQYAIFSIVVQAPDGTVTRVRLTPEAYFGIVAATNFKQRTRKMVEYYYADLNHFAVAGTPNRLEYDQGFFVKNGDGMADIKPIAHLYKSQVYQLAAYLGIPEEIQHREPTTDTYSMQQSQEEFYFALPYRQMDLVLYGKDQGWPAMEVAEKTGLTVTEVEAAFRMIEAKRRAAEYLHRPPVVFEFSGPLQTSAQQVS
jgi:NAD+ synthase